MNASPRRMPSLFVGHGSPMNALADNEFTRAWRALGAVIPRPRAIVAVSAHWYTRGVLVTTDARPRTIHDFGGFPKPLYAVQYPAPGDPALAERLVTALAAFGARPSADWGLDHGTWSVLVHTHPAADVPVVQVSLDATQPAEVHHAIGRALAPLREEGVLLLGSGGIVHNLGRVDWQGGSAPPTWATTFDARVREALLAGEDERLIDYPQLDPSARVAVPTPEHYLPLLYTVGSRLPGDALTLPVGGFELGSISMTAAMLAAS